MPGLPTFEFTDAELRTRFESLRSRADVAKLLAVPTSFLTWVLYRKGVDSFYRHWEIAKKGGGTRTITAPMSSVYVLQSRLNRALQSVYTPKPCVHGFVRDRSVVTNAREHLGKPFVLNVDLEDFFPSLNYGRVRGVLMASPFDCGVEAATTIAQIACVDGALPIGGPTSPVLSNMISMRLDGRLMRLAGAHQCWYTRYADDLTFSSRKRSFPAVLATLDEESGRTDIGDELVDAVEENGFTINHRKTRLQTRDVRQAVTGVTVNTKLNVDRRYVRGIRAMLYSLETLGRNGAQAKLEQVYGKDRWNNAAPDLLEVIHGKLAYLQMIKGADDAVVRRYRQQFENLTSGRPRLEGVSKIDAEASVQRHVFISYVREDTEVVDQLVQDFEQAGITYWRDKDDLPPGVFWKKAIKEAIASGSVFLACFSSASEAKGSSFMREELAIAIEEIRRRPENRTWFIPVKLDECDVPDLQIRPGLSLRDIQSSALFEDWSAEMLKLIQAIELTTET